MSHLEEYKALVKDTLKYINPDPLPPVPEPKVEVIAMPPPPKPEIVEEVKKAEPKEPPPPVIEPIKPLELTPLKTKDDPIGQDIKAALRKVAPSLKFVDEVPSDAIAKRVKEAYLAQKETPDIPILVMDKPAPLLKSLAKAINTVHGYSHIVDGIKFEREKRWDLFLKSPNLKLILIPDVALWSALDLMRYYREIPKENKRFLGNVPLILIPDLSLYDKDPMLKRSLWNVISSHLQHP